jgi:flagellar hook-associated protein 1 FlgK
MSLLNGTLQIGRSALIAQQAAIQVTSSNIANASDTNYTRQTVELSSTTTGSVELTSVEREVDEAVEEQLRSATSDVHYDQTMSDYLSQVETLYNELTDTDISSGLSGLFDAFSSLASNPEDPTVRSTVIQEAKTVADQIQSLRTDLVDLYSQISDDMNDAVSEINDLSSQLAELNNSISSSTDTTGTSFSSLLDQRDAILKELSQYADIKTTLNENGTATVYIGTSPLVQGTEARQLEVVMENDGETSTPKVCFTDTGEKADIESGTIGALVELYNTAKENIDDLDTLASSLIFEVNKIHCSGQGLTGYTATTSTNKVTDTTATLNNAGLAFTPTSGSFTITLKDSTTDPATETVTQIGIEINEDGTGTSLEDLAAKINTIDNMNATITADGRLVISSTNDDYTFTFNDDSSNVLACLGINSFFSGTDASDIEVSSELSEDPNLLACARSESPESGDSTNIELLADLASSKVDSLNGQSITDYYTNVVTEVGSKVSSAEESLTVDQAILASLQSQRDATSGVSLDEETINLMAYQRAFQGAAKLVSVVDELLDTVINMI